MNDLLSKIINIILRRDESIDAIVATFDKTRNKLVATAERLRTKAAQEEAEAAKLIALAKAKSDQAERGITIADRFAALTK